MFSSVPANSIIEKYRIDQKDFYQKFLKPFYAKYPVKHRRASQIHSHENSSICPQCKGDTRYDSDNAEIYCTECGLVVKASIKYVGNRKVVYPYGILI